MASPAIGAYTMISMKGEFQTLAEDIEDITRPNAHGSAIRLLGQRGPIFQLLTGVDVDDAAAAEVEATAYKALVGTLQSVVDQHSQTHTNVAVLGVDVTRKTALAVAVGGLSSSAGYWVEATWKLQETNIV